MSDLFLEAMQKGEQKPDTPQRRGQAQTGRVVAIGDTDVFMDMGSKSECLVPKSEFSVLPKIGDQVTVVVKEMRDGVMIASRLDAEKFTKMDEVKKACSEGLPVQGTIRELVSKDGTPKGYLVTLGRDVEGFLPLSHVDTRRDDKLDALIGQTMDFAVLEVERGRIAVSRREFLQKTVKKLYGVFFEKHKEGDLVNGKVERVEEDFLVLTVEGIRAFLHVSDFSWKYLADLRKIVSLGDAMEVVITRLDPSKNSVRVGKKQLTPDPWQKAGESYQAGDVVKGKVTAFRRDGAMIEVEDGVEAFLAVGEMSWTERVRDPKKLLSTGQIVEVKIRNVSPERRRMDVSLRDIQENPWKAAAQNYNYGRKVEGTVTSIVDFGVFVKLPDGIEGLMRKEDVDWLDPNVDLRKKFKKGDKVQVMVLELNAEKEKLRLGYKQLSDNPYKVLSMNYPKGSVVKARVKDVQEHGVVVTILTDGDPEAFIHVSQLAREKVEKPSDVLKAGDEVQALVRTIDTQKLKIELSIRDFLNNEERVDSAKYMASGRPGHTTASIGALIQEKRPAVPAEETREKPAAAQKTKTPGTREDGGAVPESDTSTKNVTETDDESADDEKESL